MATMSIGSGPYFRAEIWKPAARPATPRILVFVTNDVGWTLSEGKDLYRQRGCVGCHRYEGYDKEPEDLLSIAQQIKLIEGEKKDNSSKPTT